MFKRITPFLFLAMPLFLTTDNKVSPTPIASQTQAAESLPQEDTFKLSTMGELKQWFTHADSAYQQAQTSADKIQVMQEVFDFYEGNYTGKGADLQKTADENKLFNLLMAHATASQKLTTEAKQAAEAERFRVDLKTFWTQVNR